MIVSTNVHGRESESGGGDADARRARGLSPFSGLRCAAAEPAVLQVEMFGECRVTMAASLWLQHTTMDSCSSALTPPPAQPPWRPDVRVHERAGMTMMMMMMKKKMGEDAGCEGNALKHGNHFALTITDHYYVYDYVFIIYSYHKTGLKITLM